ncbi:putative PGG domain-containing protein [Rosa chinensis]|uniref:Putative PGG domain-containing protein n=1 Tax=Rosa chinensis TaxID=74649 RepID=A0A2P6PBA2_ROSCH|nr:putative PGG domain-containing protein [Rosa chinensis]
MKLKHLQINKFLLRMGEVVRYQNNPHDIVKKSMFAAIEKGHVEFVSYICRANKELIYIYDDVYETKGYIFHFSIECRQEKIYSLIYGLDKETRKKIGLAGTESMKSMLFSACLLSPESRLNHIQGASLQMQRELQWFKEVARMVPSEIHDRRDNVNDLTTHELFTINHKNLKKEAEMSMKGTATSCTVVGALVVTIMFAVAFTVPGGNHSDTGIPLFIDKKLFMVFIV